MKVTNDYVLFFTGKDVFSNFYHSEFKHQGLTFEFSEKAVMYRKAKLFGANNIANLILKANSPQECKRLGRSREIRFDDVIWENNKVRIYKEVLIDKFKSRSMRKELLRFKDKKFVEASPYDKIWGAGLSQDDPRILDEKQWKGSNLLGQILDEVREFYLED